MSAESGGRLGSTRRMADLSTVGSSCHERFQSSEIENPVAHFKLRTYLTCRVLVASFDGELCYGSTVMTTRRAATSSEVPLEGASLSFQETDILVVAGTPTTFKARATALARCSDRPACSI